MKGSLVKFLFVFLLFIPGPASADYYTAAVYNVMEGGSEGGVEQTIIGPGVTDYNGETITGTLSASDGDATVTNAILDVTALENIIIGTGCRVTEAMVGLIHNLDLSGALTGSNGIIDVEEPLLVDSTGERSVVNLMNSITRSTLTDSSAAADIKTDGRLVFHANSLGSTLVAVNPGQVATADTNEADGITITSTGRLRFVSEGIAVTMAPACYDTDSLNSEFSRLGITSTTDTDGVMTINLGGGTLWALRFDWATTTPDNAPTAEAISFGSVGDPADHGNFHYTATYPDGSVQNLPPAIHDLASFSSTLQQLGIEFAVNSNSGVIDIKDSQGHVTLRFIADYVLDASAGRPGVSFLAAGDLNGDGLPDYYITTTRGRQLIYSIPVSN